MGAGHEEIPENAAEPVRQWPALGLGQGGQRRGKQHDSSGPGEQAEPPALWHRAE